MAERKFSNKELPIIREKISDRRLKGWTEAQIAEDIGTSQQAVSYHIRQMDEDLANRTTHNTEVKRQLQAASADQTKKWAWKIVESSDSPRIQLAALSTVGHANGQINSLYHLDKIPPLNLNEEESKEQVDEELAAMVLEVMGGKNNGIENSDQDSLESSLLADSTAQPNSAEAGPFEETSPSDDSGLVTEDESCTSPAATKQAGNCKSKKTLPKKALPKKMAAKKKVPRNATA